MGPGPWTRVPVNEKSMRQRELIVSLTPGGVSVQLSGVLLYSKTGSSPLSVGLSPHTQACVSNFQFYDMWERTGVPY